MKEIIKTYKGKNSDFNLRTIEFDSVEDFKNSKGEFITYTKKDFDFKSDVWNLNYDAFSLNGINLYFNPCRENSALRIYQDLVQYPYCIHDDDRLVNELQKRQKNVKLTEFPTGVVSVGDKIIGQEIPYYTYYRTLFDKVGEINNKKQILLYYKNIIQILKELLDNGIIYKDVHARNFLVDKDIKLIDFESQFVNFDNLSSSYEDMMFNLVKMFNDLDSKYSLDLAFVRCDKIEDVEKQLKYKIK